MSERTFMVQHVPPYSVVRRVSDGRIGVLLGKYRDAYIVEVTPNFAVSLKPTEQVEVVRYPAELARDYLRNGGGK